MRLLFGIGGTAIIYRINCIVVDIPICLTNQSDLTFTSGYDEFKQSLYLLIKTWYGRFLQSPRMGSRVAPHTTDAMLLRTGIAATIEQLRGCECMSVDVYGDSVTVRVSYRGRVSDFVFSISSFA